jgi:hypothetical protein
MAKVVPDILDNVHIGAIGQPGEDNKFAISKPVLHKLCSVLQINVVLKDTISSS